MTLVDLSSRSSDIDSGDSSDSKKEGDRDGKMGGATDIISCTIIPHGTSSD